MSLNTVTIGDLPVYDPPENVVGVNRFVMRTGASRCGRGVFLMIRKDYEKLVTDTAKAGGATTLKMSGDPGPGLTLQVILAGAEPVSTTVGTSNRDTDLMKVTVYDLRAKNFLPINKFYNVMQDGFPFDGSNKPVCYQSTLKASDPGPGFEPWSWSGLLADAGIFAASGDTMPGDLPSWSPYNLVWDNVPLCLILDDIAAQLFYVVGFDHQQAAIADAQTLFPPYLSARGTEQQSTGYAANFDLINQIEPKGALLKGSIAGDPASAERNYNRLPGKINVVFRGTGDSDPYSTHRSYTSTVKTGFGSSDYSIVLNVGTQFAFWNGSSWANQSALDTVAADLAARAAIFISQGFGQAEYAGIWPFRPDGRIRQVEWVSYPKGHPQEGARTIIKSDNAKDWLPTDSLNDPINLTTNQEVIGLGGSASSIGSNGTKYIWDRNPPVRLVIAANWSEPGVYTANPLTPVQIFSAGGTTAITLADIGTAAPQTVLAVNTYELNKDPTDVSQWDLVAGQVFVGTYLCHDDETPSKAVYTIEGLDAGSCSG